MRKFLSALFTLIIILGLMWLNNEEQLDAPDIALTDELRVHVLDVGQGDSILIQGKGQNILVDTGPPNARKQFLAALDEHGVKKVDLLILTHAHADHIGNATALIERIPVAKVMESPAETSAPGVTRYYQAMKKKGVKLEIPKAGDKVEIGEGVYLEFFTPIKGEENPKNVNNSSLAFMLHGGKTRMLFTGDMEKDFEKKLVDLYGNRLRADLLKSPHHGSSTSSSAVFLKAVQPKAAFVSCAKGNDYGHPHREIVSSYKKQGIEMYRTDIQGTLSVVINQEGYQISTEKESGK